MLRLFLSRYAKHSRLGQRCLLLLLIAALLLPALASPLLADDGEREAEQAEAYRFPPIVTTASFPDPLLLKFEDVATAMRAGSPVLMSNAANREVLFYNLGQAADQQRNANSALYNLSQAMTGLQQMRDGLDTAFAQSAALGQPPSYTDMVLKSAVEAQLSMTQSQLASQAVTAAQADRGYASTGSMAATITQLDDAKLQVIYSALSLYHGYWSATRRIELIEEELSLLKRQLTAVITLQELGRATVQTAKSLREGIAAMEQGLKAACLEQQGLLNELNLLLGRPANSTLQLEPITAPDLELMRQADYASAWKAVYKESYTLKGKRYTQGGLQQQYDDVVLTFGELGDRAWRAEQQLAAAKMETALTEEQLSTRFAKFYERMLQSLDSYDLEAEKLITAEDTWQRAAQRYELGYLSESELLRTKNEYNKQKAALTQAADDLALTWQRWLLIQQGMDLSAGER